MERLDKLLASTGRWSRREAKALIQAGRVLVDGMPARRGEDKADPSSSRILVDGAVLDWQAHTYIMLSKPAGLLTATEDARQKTVLDLLPDGLRRKGLFPVGRLDKDTEGLLLLTDDGELAHRLLSPRHHVDKCYYAKVQGIVTKEDKKRFSDGVNIGTEGSKEQTAYGRLEIIRADSGLGISEIRLTIQEGRYHQVKRMFEAVGKKVLYLRRESMGSLVLDKDLKPGECRRLTDEELRNL